MSAQLSDTSRLETFADGVYAIAITLLVLDLKVPGHGIDTSAGLWHALGQQWPSYAAYALSFIVVGIMWANHHNIFRYIRGTTHSFIMLNILLLLFTVLTPFTTALVAEYLLVPHAQVVAVAVYGGIFTCTAITYNALWRYASHKRRLLRPEVSDTVAQSIRKEFALGPIFYAAATGLAFVSIWLSLAIHGFLALLYVLPRQFRS